MLVEESSAASVAQAGIPPVPPGLLGLLRRALRTRRGQVGASLCAVIVALSALGPAVAPDSPNVFVTIPFAAPGPHNLLGADVIGRDVLSRVLNGGWEIILMALAATALGVAIGSLVGVTAALRGGRWDSVLMRASDVLLAFPQLVLALLLVSIVGPKVWLIVVAVAVGHAPQVARVIRSAALDVTERDFVKALALIGVSPWRAVTTEVIPNLTSPLMVEIGVRLTYSIMVITALSFLGFGLPPPNANWGTMISDNRPGLTANPWGVISPAACIAMLTVGTNLFTDALARASLGIDGAARSRSRGRRAIAAGRRWRSGRAPGQPSAAPVSPARRVTPHD